jgi:hypothetical protein
MMLISFGTLFLSLGQAVEIDRLVATVNGQVITAGDLMQARRLNALMLHHESDSPKPQREETERLINLELMRQEMASFHIKSEETNPIEEQMSEIRQAYQDLGGLSAMLNRWRIEESELKDYLLLQASLLRFVDLRFRPFVAVTTEEIQSYYRDKFVPDLREHGTAVPALNQVSSQIEALLAEEKINDAILKWTDDLRRRARIEYFADGAP